MGAGGVFSQDTHLPPLPPCPRVRTPEQNQAPENQPSRQRWQGEGGGSWSLWHLQGRHLRLHHEVLVESDHCVPARDRKESWGQKESPAGERPAGAKLLTSSAHLGLCKSINECQPRVSCLKNSTIILFFFLELTIPTLPQTRTSLDVHSSVLLSAFTPLGNRYLGLFHLAKLNSRPLTTAPHSPSCAPTLYFLFPSI